MCADQERRGDSEHAWTELTWIKFFKFLFYGWALGVFCGLIFAAIAVWTNWYWLILVALGQVFITQWWLGPAITIILIIAVYIKRPRKKEVQKRGQQSENQR